MTNPTEAPDAIEQALQHVFNITDASCSTIPMLLQALTHLATLRQQEVDLVAFREAVEFLNDVINTNSIESQSIEADLELGISENVSWADLLPTVKAVEQAPAPPAADGGQGA